MPFVKSGADRARRGNAASAACAFLAGRDAGRDSRVKLRNRSGRGGARCAAAAQHVHARSEAAEHQRGPRTQFQCGVRVVRGPREAAPTGVDTTVRTVTTATFVTAATTLVTTATVVTAATTFIATAAVVTATATFVTAATTLVTTATVVTAAATVVGALHRQGTTTGVHATVRLVTNGHLRHRRDHLHRHGHRRHRGRHRGRCPSSPGHHHRRARHRAACHHRRSRHRRRCC